MELFPALEEAYSKEHRKAGEAQEMAYFIAFGPIVFQVGRLMVKFGILEMLRDQEQGMTQAEIAEKTGLSSYAVKVLIEGALCIGLVLVDPATDRFTLSKTGWFLLTDPAIRVNVDFNHDVNYEGWFLLEEALKEGRPAGLAHFGDWPTIYEGLSQFPPKCRKVGSVSTISIPTTRFGRRWKSSSAASRKPCSMSAATRAVGHCIVSITTMR